MQAVFFGIAHDLAAVKFRCVVGLLGGGLQLVQIGKAGLYALDLAAQAGQFKIPVGFAVQLDGKGVRVGECIGLLIGEAGIAAQGFVLAVVGIGGLAIIKGVLFLLQAVLEQFAGVGVGQVYRAGANAADFVKNGVNLLVLLPKRFAAGVLLLFFAYREVAAAANKDGGAGRFVAVIGVVVVGKAAGVAVKQGGFVYP